MFVHCTAPNPALWLHLTNKVYTHTGLSFTDRIGEERNTRSSDVADGPRDELCQLKSCQLYKHVVQQIHEKSQINGVRGLQLTDL